MSTQELERELMEETEEVMQQDTQKKKKSKFQKQNDEIKDLSKADK